jgi:hypothetical protein
LEGAYLPLVRGKYHRARQTLRIFLRSLVAFMGYNVSGQA